MQLYFNSREIVDDEGKPFELPWVIVSARSIPRMMLRHGVRIELSMPCGLKRYESSFEYQLDKTTTKYTGCVVDYFTGLLELLINGVSLGIQPVSFDWGHSDTISVSNITDPLTKKYPVRTPKATVTIELPLYRGK